MPHKCQECGWEHTTPEEDADDFWRAVEAGMRSDDPMTRYFSREARDRALRDLSPLRLTDLSGEGRTAKFQRFPSVTKWEGDA